MKSILRGRGLHTVCEEANCPNISECFSNNVATVLLLGNVCTRGCKFCNIRMGIPESVVSDEPKNVLELARKLDLKHLVLTSVTRDDLVDGGAKHYVNTIRALRSNIKDLTIEVLTPDFKGDFDSLKKVLDEDIVVFNHNVEMVPSLYKFFRERASFKRSVDILKFAKRYSNKYKVKTGFMLGLGEVVTEVYELIDILSDIGVDILTVGQYYAPSNSHAVVKKLYTKKEFNDVAKYAQKIGIKKVYSASNVRSSFNAKNFL